jgi:hypothetical protein
MKATYFDKDGLIYSKYIKLSQGKLFLDGQEIYITPEVNGVFGYLTTNKNLWHAARISVSNSRLGMKRAPIFGIPFRLGLQEALMSNESHIKAVYQRDDWELIQGHAVVGSLVAHTSSSPDIVEFEAWQILDITSESFYIHAIISKETGLICHLDGATMHHSAEEKTLIASRGKKIRGAAYKKHFRIDGSFHIHVAEELMELYLPLDDLTEEFLQSIS